MAYETSFYSNDDVNDYGEKDDNKDDDKDDDRASEKMTTRLLRPARSQDLPPFDQSHSKSKLKIQIQNDERSRRRVKS